jgi:hypothetical protein
MGYRTWNDVHGNVNATYMSKIVDAVVSRRRLVNGKPTSLADLGYGRVGLDDGWQACSAGWAPPGRKPSFHAEDGTPLINSSLFPSLKDMVHYGHARGVKCVTRCTRVAGGAHTSLVLLRRPPQDGHVCAQLHLHGRVHAAGRPRLCQPLIRGRRTDADPGGLCTCCAAKRRHVRLHATCRSPSLALALGRQDGVKIDNCGDDAGAGFAARTAHLDAAGAKLLIENSNQGFGNVWPSGTPSRNPPGPPRENPPNRTVLPDYCPFHMFRTGGDIGPSFGDVYQKLQYTRPYLTHDSPVSRPGCWAFPDMVRDL